MSSVVYTYSVLWPILVSQVYVKQLKGHQRMGDAGVVAHYFVIFELFCHKIPSSRDISYQVRYHCAARNRLRLDVTLSKSYLLAELRGLSVDADRLTELVPRLTSLEMSSDLLIHHASS